MALGINSASIRNESQGYFLGQGLRWLVCRADNLTAFMYQLPSNSGNLNLLEP
jgi:hypothetical protein